MNFLEKYKKICVTFVSVVIIFYTIFLLVIPNVVNLNSFKKDIQKIVFDIAKLNFDFQDMKIVTTPTLKAGIKIKNAKIAYPNKKEIFTLGKAEAKISLLPLLFKTLQVSDITINTPKISLLYTKDGQIDIVKYLVELFEQQQTTTETASAELPVKISDKLPKIIVTNYDLILADEKTSNKIALNGDNFVFDNAIINKHLRLFADGKILVNENENILYDVKISSYWPVIASASTSQEREAVELPYIDFINEIVKFNPKAILKTDLKISEKSGKLNMNGFANIDGVSVVLDGTKLPDSYLHINAKGNKITLNSDLRLNNTENALINSIIELGKKPKIDLNCKAEKITFSGLQKFFAALLNSLHIKNDIDTFVTKGYITADFGFKTNSKKIESHGFFKIIDGNISHKLVPVKIGNITIDINFKDNSLNINKASADINDTTILANGKIDSKANVDIDINTEKIDIAPLFNAFAPIDIKKMYILQSGHLTTNAFVKGNIASIEPNVNIALNNFIFKDKSNLFVLSNEKSSVDIKAKGKTFDGSIDIKNANFKMNNPHLKIALPEAKVKINPDLMSIVPFDILMNSSKVNISGDIKNYAKKPNININCNGSILSSDLKNLLPKELHSMVAAKGVIPLKTTLTGDFNKILLNAQSYTNKDNYFAPITIKKLVDKSGLLNVALNFSNNSLSLDDVSFYQSTHTQFSDDFIYNKNGAIKIIGLNGIISNLNSTHPTMKIALSIPEQLAISIPALFNASLIARGDVIISGFLTNPAFKGFISIKNINIPDILTKIQDVDVELNSNLLSAKIQNLDIGGTSMNVDAQASTVLNNVFLIKDLKLTSTNFDVDNLFKAMDKMFALMPPATQTANSSTPAVVLPAKVAKGIVDIQKLKMKQIGGDLIATNITGDFNIVNDLFKLSNLKATVYNGLVTGDVTYHLGTTAITAAVKGKGVDANQAVTVFVALKDQMMSDVDFNANVKLKGATYEEQMKTLNGIVNFSMKDGQMGSLGRFETFLKADNLLSQNFISTHIGSLVNTIAPYNTGKFSYLNGDLKLVNGVAQLDSIKMSGPHMSLLIKGDVNVLSMDSNLSILGSLSPEVNTALGVVSDLSVEKFAAYIPKFGTRIASAMNSYNTPLKEAELAKIPALTPSKENTKSFKVILDGNLNNPPSAIKKFQWLNTPEKIKEEQISLENTVTQTLKTTPITKEEVKKQVVDSVKNKIENNEKVQEIKENKTVKTLTGIYNFYKKSQPETTEPAQN